MSRLTRHCSSSPGGAPFWTLEASRPCPLPPCPPSPGPLLLTPSWLRLQPPDPGRCRPGASLTSSLSPTHPSSLSPPSVYQNIDLVMAVHGTGLPANRDDQRSGPLPLDSDGTVLLSHPLSWPRAPISYCGARLAPDAADPPSMSASETVDGRLQLSPGLILGRFNTVTTTSPHCVRDREMTLTSGAGGSWDAP